jgi:hypothetical protein
MMSLKLCTDFVTVRHRGGGNSKIANDVLQMREGFAASEQLEAFINFLSGYPLSASEEHRVLALVKSA